MTVVLGPGWPGILLHEAVGHGLEGDFNRKGVSAFSDRLGSASRPSSARSSTTARSRSAAARSTSTTKGTPTSRTVLIENGILRGYLQDRHERRAMGMPLTGNGRRESFAHLPMPRMTNTFMLAGDDAPEDIIRSVDRGLYAVSFGGGRSTSRAASSCSPPARPTDRERQDRPAGEGRDAHRQRPRRADAHHARRPDLALDEGIGTCGKDGQSVPVGVGLPTVRIDGITVGGTRA